MSTLPPDPVAETIEQLATVRARAVGEIGRHQRAVERLTHVIGRPRSVAIVLAAVVLWIAFNLVQIARGQEPVDPPPFFWLQGIVALSALVTTMMVLTTELRQTRHEEERAQLDLQVNLLAERKITKLIALVEELRRDMPDIRHRRDREAEALTEALDPSAALENLRETFEEPERETK